MNKEKKIIFVIKGLNAGGVEKALVTFANLLTANYDISIYSIEGKGDFEKDLKESIEVIYASRNLAKYVNLMSTHKNQLRNDLKQFFRKGFYRYMQKAGLGKLTDIGLFIEVKISDKYDIAISYTGYPGIWDEIVLSKIEAEKKIVWIHNDPYRLGIDRIKAKQYYGRFDAIINVSEDCKDKFNSICPDLMDKNYLIYNIIDEEELKKKSNGMSPYNSDKFIISTVARIQNSSKRFDRIISCCEKMVKEGHENFKWHIIGDGADMGWLKKQIELKNLTEHIIASGFNLNPYPYIKHSDLFVLASDYEGLPVTLIEAKILGVPIVVTNFDCAKEAVKDGYNGIIVDKDVDSLFEGIMLLMQNKDAYRRLKSNAMMFYGTTDLSLSKFNKTLRDIKL